VTRLAAEPPPLTPDRLAHLVAGSTVPQRVVLCAQSPDARVRADAARLRRLTRAGLDLVPPITLGR